MRSAAKNYVLYCWSDLNMSMELMGQPRECDHPTDLALGKARCFSYWTFLKQLMQSAKLQAHEAYHGCMPFGMHDSTARSISNYDHACYVGIMRSLFEMTMGGKRQMVQIPAHS